METRIVHMYNNQGVVCPGGHLKHLLRLRIQDQMSHRRAHKGNLRKND